MRIYKYTFLLSNFKQVSIQEKKFNAQRTIKLRCFPVTYLFIVII